MILAQSGGGSSGARDVLAATVIIGIIGVIANAVLSAVESRAFAWHESQRVVSG
jgi:ABC-type nitrate/sulfonate/bicarbonate transport system permease component